MGVFKKNNNNQEMTEVSEKELSEITADAFNEVYGALVENINSDRKYKKVQENPAYINAKDFIERKYKQLDRAVLIEVSTLMTLYNGLKVKFVPSKTAFIEIEADFKPDSPDEAGRRESFKIAKFTEKGEKVFDKYYTKEEALLVKEDRNTGKMKEPKQKKLSFFKRLEENEYFSLNDGSGRER